MLLENVFCREYFVAVFALVFDAFMSLHVNLVVGAEVESFFAFLTVEAEFPSV